MARRGSNNGTGLLKGQDDFDHVAAMYQKWILSEPFDVGLTIGSILREISKEPIRGLANKMREVAKVSSANSKSNGALMRCTPIPIYGIKKNMSFDKIANLAIMDASLTHSNPIVQEVNSIYCVAIACLLKRHGDISFVLENCKKYIKSEEVDSWFSMATNYRIHEDDVEKMASQLEDLSNFREQTGFVKHGFMLAFCLLVNKISYNDSICLSIMLGGDTDTNACIVGGLLGAFWGFDKLPKKLIKKMLDGTFIDDDEIPGRERPDWLMAKNIVEIVNRF